MNKCKKCNPNPHEEIINRLFVVWNKYPELRLGQLIYSAFYDEALKDFFYTTDEKFIQLIEAFDERQSRE